MIRNSWRARFMFAGAMWITGIVHHTLVHDVSNTPTGLFIYHASAAATDFLLLKCAVFVLRSKLLDYMQNLCLVSMVLNFAGWILYLAWKPPSFYDSSIMVTSYVQYLLLIFAGYDDNHLGLHLVRRYHHVRTQFHFRKTIK